MEAKKYVELSDRTCKHIGEEGLLVVPAQYDLIHAAFGIAGESGEIVDAVKKHVFYGKPLDVKNLREEVGDVMWYIALMCRTLNVTLEELMQENIDKLTARYPEKYTDELAITRLDKQ